MTIHTIPALGDNLIHLITEASSAAVVDPGDAEPVREALQRLDLRLELILITHTHPDHTGGCHALKTACGCTIAGPVGTPDLDRTLHDGDSVTFKGHTFQVIGAPGHMRDHILYYDPDAGAVFTGDTLIAGACGRILGCTASDLWNSLKTIRDLPDATRVYGGHDYILENLAFAATLEPGNHDVGQRLAAEQARVKRNDILAAATVAEETRTNPFLRCDDPALADAVGMKGAAPEEIFAHIRRRKDGFNL